MYSTDTSRALARAQRESSSSTFLLMGGVPRRISRDSLAAVTPFYGESRLLPALQAAAEGGASKAIVISDGGIEDYQEVQRWLPRLGITLDVVPVGEEVNMLLARDTIPASSETTRAATNCCPGTKVYYNYEMTEFPEEEAPGASVFYKNEAGEIFHTYSAYARGLDIMVGAYNWLDMAPKGRDEDQLSWSMAWVRHHDRYEDDGRTHKAA